MADAIDMRITGDFTEYAVTNPPLFDMLMLCVQLQPIIDPEAGYGVFQIPIAFHNMHLDVPHVFKLLKLMENNPYKFYVYVRAWQMTELPQSRATFINVIDQEIEPDYCSLCGYLNDELPAFAADVVSVHIFP